MAKDDSLSDERWLEKYGYKKDIIKIKNNSLEINKEFCNFLKIYNNINPDKNMGNILYLTSIDSGEDVMKKKYPGSQVKTIRGYDSNIPNNNYDNVIIYNYFRYSSDPEKIIESICNITDKDVFIKESDIFDESVSRKIHLLDEISQNKYKKVDHSKTLKVAQISEMFLRRGFFVHTLIKTRNPCKSYFLYIRRR